jgi:signal transduction histidine kinase
MKNEYCGWGRPPVHANYVMRERPRFFRRIAIVAMAIIGLGVGGFFALVWTALTRFGVIAPSTPSWPFFLVAMWFVAFALVGFLRVGRRIGSPLRAVMEAADRVADGDYSVRVKPYGPPPVRALAHSFNTMTERLERNDHLRRNLMADVAHELRTPLTVIQGRIEGLLDGVYARDDASLEQVLEETRVLSRLVEDLRTLALSEAGALKLERQSTDLSALTRDVADAFAAQAAAKGVTVVADSPSLAADIDPVRIREVLTNLVSNALRHTPAPGSVTLSVAQSDADSATIAVADTGEGMSREQAERVFERFYKGPDSRGTGLGLAIAHGIVVAHGGRIDVTSEPGRGTTIEFTIPTSRE